MFMIKQTKFKIEEINYRMTTQNRAIYKGTIKIHYFELFRPLILETFLFSYYDQIIILIFYLILKKIHY